MTTSEASWAHPLHAEREFTRGPLGSLPWSRYSEVILSRLFVTCGIFHMHRNRVAAGVESRFGGGVWLWRESHDEWGGRSLVGEKMHVKVMSAVRARALLGRYSKRRSQCP